MFEWLAKALAALSLKLRQPLSSFCDLETSDGTALVGKRGEYVSVLRVQGLRKMTLRRDVEGIAEALRMDLSGWTYSWRRRASASRCCPTPSCSAYA
jgi:intracellular multiplication protein IcmB